MFETLIKGRKLFFKFILYPDTSTTKARMSQPKLQPLQPRRMDIYQWHEQGRPEEDLKPEQASMQPCILIFDCAKCHLFLPYRHMPHICLHDVDQDEGFCERDNLLVRFANEIYDLIADPVQDIWVLRLDDSCWCRECFKTVTLRDVV